MSLDGGSIDADKGAMPVICTGPASMSNDQQNASDVISVILLDLQPTSFCGWNSIVPSYA